MKYYNDETNRAGMKLLFMAVQMAVILIVFAFIYTALVAIRLAVAQQGLSALMYLPVLFVLLVFPFLLYRYRRWFNAGRMLYAYSWTLASASLIIVLLYLYIDQIVG